MRKSNVMGDIAVDPSGNAYVVGDTLSPTFPIVNPFQRGMQHADAFVAKLDSKGSSLVYSTFLGGTGSDYAKGVVVDSRGSAFVFGETTSTDFPQAGPANENPAGAFVVQFSEDGSYLASSQFFSSATACGAALESSGILNVTGRVSDSHFAKGSVVQMRPLEVYSPSRFRHSA